MVVCCECGDSKSKFVSREPFRARFRPVSCLEELQGSFPGRLVYERWNVESLSLGTFSGSYSGPDLVDARVCVVFRGALVLVCRVQVLVRF